MPVHCGWYVLLDIYFHLNIIKCLVQSKVSHIRLVLSTLFFSSELELIKGFRKKCIFRKRVVGYMIYTFIHFLKKHQKSYI